MTKTFSTIRRQQELLEPANMKLEINCWNWSTHLLSIQVNRVAATGHGVKYKELYIFNLSLPSKGWPMTQSSIVKVYIYLVQPFILLDDVWISNSGFLLWKICCELLVSKVYCTIHNRLQNLYFKFKICHILLNV